MRVGGRAAFGACAVVAGGEFGVVAVAGSHAGGAARPLGQPAGPVRPAPHRHPHGAAWSLLGPHPRRAGAAGEGPELLPLVTDAPPPPPSPSPFHPGPAAVTSRLPAGERSRRWRSPLRPRVLKLPRFSFLCPQRRRPAGARVPGALRARLLPVSSGVRRGSAVPPPSPSRRRFEDTPHTHTRPPCCRVSENRLAGLREVGTGGAFGPGGLSGRGKRELLFPCRSGSLL